MRPHENAPPPPSRDGLPPARSHGDLVGPFEITLAAELGAPAAARAAVGAWMAGHVAERTVADAQLLVSELVANSVRHADTPADPVVRVRAGIRGDAVHLEVEDGGSGGSIARRTPDMQHGGGFGLNMVEALARRWGVHRNAGTRVWAEIGIGASGDPADRGSVMPAGSNGDRRPDAASAQARADEHRRRAGAARRAADKAATEYARRSHHRVAELHAALARHHAHSARTLRRGDSDPGAA